MAETAIHLVDNVIPEAPVRQFVVTFPVQLRLWLARNSVLLADICQKVNEEISKFIVKKSEIKYNLNKKLKQNTGQAKVLPFSGQYAMNLIVHKRVVLCQSK